MSEASDLERTEPASARRLEQARDDGRVARSTDLSAFLLLAAGIGGMWALGTPLIEGLAGMLREGLRLDFAAATDPAAMGERMRGLGLAAALAIAPLLLLLLGVALVGPLAMSGWILSAKPLVPDLTRLDPLRGLKRLFSTHGAVELGKCLLKAALVGSVAYAAMQAIAARLLALGAAPVEPALAQLGHLLAYTAAAPVAALAVVAAVDAGYQHWRHRSQLRMTRDEVRREHKETEGDPLLKARIRSLQREAARKRMMSEIPSADVVVTNPTHYAVALKYSGGKGAPRVVAKGARAVALRIRELAASHGVPLVEAPALARALYKNTDLGQEVPAALYAAVAEVLAYVYSLRVYRSRGGKAPRPPVALPVPESLDIPGAHT